METLDQTLVRTVLLLAGLALTFLVVILAWSVWGDKGNPRVHRARQRRQQLEKRADSEARLTSEVLASADTMGDMVADVRQGLRGQDRLEQRRRELERLTSGPVAGGGPPAPPPHP